MLHQYLKISSILTVIMDLIGLNLLFFLMLLVTRHPASLDNHIIIYLIVSNTAWIVALYLTGACFFRQEHLFIRIARRTTHAAIMYVIFSLLFLFLYKYPYSRLFVMLYTLSSMLFLASNRFLFYINTTYILRKKGIEKKVVILGYNELSKKLAATLQTQKSNLKLEGYFEEYNKVHELSYYPVIGNLQDCVPYAKLNNIGEIYSTLSPEQLPYLYTLANEAEQHFILFRFVPDFRMFVNRQLHIDYFGNLPVISLRPAPQDDIGNRIQKRTFDLLFSLMITCCLLSWLIPLLAVLIRLESKGPVFFVQQRTGRNNKIFCCYKLRTMYVNSDAHLKQAIRNDMRFTGLGRILRKTNMDELPQFINVLLGNMSVVGPRPHMLKHTEEYSRITQEYMVRHFLKPGITGWAQIKGLRGEIKEKSQLRKRIEHDIWYMENWSLYLDLRIILLTIYNTLKGDKNAF